MTNLLDLIWEWAIEYIPKSKQEAAANDLILIAEDEELDVNDSKFYQEYGG